MCNFDTCKGKAQVKGYCSKHYQSLRRKGLIAPSWKCKDTSNFGKHVPRSAFKKGHRSWNKDLVGWVTDHHRANMIQGIKEKGAWNKGKKMPSTTGDKNANWKGGITDKNKLQRAKFHRNIQPLVFQRDDYTCQICNQHGGNLQADHIKSWSEFPELRFEINNCRTLCMPCHYYITFKRKMPEGIVWGHNLSRRIAS